MKDPRDVIIRPVVSEKSYTLLEDNVYTFEVHPSSSKPEIKDAVESIFDVDVLKVNTLIRPDGLKKAYVRLTPDHEALEIANRIGII